jgi:hypothetical protein
MYKLKRTRDGAGQVGRYSNAIQWKEDGTFGDTVGERPKIGLSMIVQQGINTFWLTTEVTTIVEDTPNYVKFRTKNSEYEWTILPESNPENSDVQSKLMTESGTEEA